MFITNSIKVCVFKKKRKGTGICRYIIIVAMFYPFSQFCEIDISLLSLQKQPKTAPNLFQRGVEYGKSEIMII